MYVRLTVQIDGLETEVHRLEGNLVTLRTVEAACHQKDQEIQSLRGTLVRIRYESRKTVLKQNVRLRRKSLFNTTENA